MVLGQTRSGAGVARGFVQVVPAVAWAAPGCAHRGTEREAEGEREGEGEREEGTERV